MSRYPFNANRTRIRVLSTRLPMVPHYMKVDTIGKNLIFKDLLPPGLYSEAQRNLLLPPQRKRTPKQTEEEEGARGEGEELELRQLEFPPFRQHLNEDEETLFLKRIDEALQLAKTNDSNRIRMQLTANDVSLYLNQLRNTLRPRNSVMEFCASVLQLLTQTIISLYQSFLGEYKNLRKMCLAQPPMEPAQILNQLDIINYKVNELQVTKRALQEEHRILTNQLRLSRTNSQPGPREMDEIRSTWSNVYHLLQQFS